MAGINITIRAQGASEFRKKMEKFRLVYPQETQDEIIERLEDAKSELSKPGKTITYPVNWDSVKQRKAFFASDGFGGGIPYIRTGQSASGWEVRAVDDMSAALFNDKPQAVYIWGNSEGQRQSRIHKGRWKLFAKVVKDLEPKIPKGVQGAITRLINKLGL